MTEPQLLRYQTAEQKPQSNQPRWRINTSHILVTGREQALQILAWLDETIPENQHACFENLAAMYSICGSNLNYGNIGWIEPGQTDKRFESALCSLRPGEWYPEPIETSWGWHVVARIE